MRSMTLGDAIISFAQIELILVLDASKIHAAVKLLLSWHS